MLKGGDLGRQEIGGESHTNLNGGSNPPTSTKYLAFIGLITNGGNEWLVGAR